MIETILRERNPSSVLPGNQYLAVGSSVSPFIAIYKRNGDTYTKLTTPASVPAYSVTGVAWNGSTHLILAHGGYPYVTVYKRTGDTFTKLSDFTTNEGYADTGKVRVDDTGGYMAFNYSLTPYVKTCTISGDTFAMCAAPAVPPATGNAGATNVQFNLNSGSGDWFALTARSSLNVYTMANPPVKVTTSFTGQGVLSLRAGLFCSNDDSTLVYGTGSSINIYQILSGPSFTPMPSPYTAISLGATCNAAAREDYYGIFLALGVTATPFLRVYDIYGWFTYTVATTPPGSVVDVAMTSEPNTQIACAHAASPFITIYKLIGETFSKLADPASLPPGAANCVAFSATF